MLKGDLDPPATAAESIKAAVGEGNGEHLWVCTQDEALRRTLREVAGVPLIFVTAAGVALEQPSGHQQEQARAREVAQRGSTRTEGASGKRARGGDEEAESGEEELDEEAAAALAARKRRKKPQAPNPLSAKKKKKLKPAPAAEPAAATKKRVRQRHRASSGKDGE